MSINPLLRFDGVLTSLRFILSLVSDYAKPSGSLVLAADRLAPFGKVLSATVRQKLDNQGFMP